MANGQYKVLLVEDEPDIREIVAMALLRDADFKLSIYPDGESALRGVAGSMEYFDVGLFNVRLPGIDGPELARRLRKMPGYAHLKVIFLTASVLAPQVQNYEIAGAVGVIGKPFDPIKLPDQVKSILTELEDRS